ncbi:MAG: radical SAM protein [Candidatus Omnitrophica bacterium]|nr:radical SAM protein [Candidatus Omnitrophota bacterium]
MATEKIELIKKANTIFRDAMRNCRICPRRCGVDRAGGTAGYCRALYNPRIYSYMPHHGEEPPISGTKGSGTIFFSHCNMKCAYCQNYDFSQMDKGEDTTIEELARIMLELQGRGCHNINLVTPTHYVPQILMALEIAMKSGLSIPIVYNTSGYELAETIAVLRGIVDIYLPDMRYSDNADAKLYSDAERYVEFNRSAVNEMHSQAGRLKMDDSSIALKGLIIRLLAIPNGISGTGLSLNYISKKLGPDTYISLMSQYYPAFRAAEYIKLSRGISAAEYKNVVDEAVGLGLNNGWIQKEPEKPNPKYFGTNIKPKGRVH